MKAEIRVENEKFHTFGCYFLRIKTDGGVCHSVKSASNDIKLPIYALVPLLFLAKSLEVIA